MAVILGNNCGLFQQMDLFLQIFQKFSRMGAVHLCVMKLEGDGEFIAEEGFSILSPDNKGIVEYAAVHADGAVNFRVDNGRCADDHALPGQIPVLPGLRRLRRIV